MRILLIVGALFCSLGYSQEAIEEYIPHYPESPVCRDAAGEITLSYQILETGLPHNIKIVKTDSGSFPRSAIRTLEKYRFKSGTYIIDKEYFITFSFAPQFTCNGPPEDDSKN